MSKARLVITAVVLAHRPVPEVCADYDVSRSWVYELLARYRTEGEAAFTPHSRRPHTTPTATPAATVELILRLRRELTRAGHDAGAETIAWHLAHHHDTTVSTATIHRILRRNDAIEPQPNKRPRSSYIRFQADQPNECWQSDFTHYRLTRPDGSPGTGVEIITWLDDHSRYLLHCSAHRRITATIVVDTFRSAAARHGYPASTLTDNGMVYTVRLAGHGRSGGRNHLEHELAILGITQKNGQPGHPQTQGKVERFQQTLKKWLTAQPHQPATIGQLQALIDAFTDTYNHHRPHRSLPGQITPAAAYQARPKASPTPDARTRDSHDRIRTDKIDKTGAVTLRIAGQLRHIGIGRTHAGTCVKLLVHDLDVTIINATTGEILRELTIDPTRDYQPTGQTTSTTQKTKNA
ncbi:IS481 family transposase [Raineyella sp. LH-20]|uniref:IS481 family transposase n=1 Tax=Raineyella sp. LH-20 TaxID=3081204 RepID=UPI0029543DF2|nr:IS481 family transposase [Raineyella sp. LH-20]WOP18039.1 IS481 family transposase [Raineyella sp. LH-20]